MFNFLLLLLNSLFKILFSNRKDLILTLMVLKKENQIYKRQLNHKQTLSLIKRSDRFILSLISTLSKRAINHLTIIRPSTLLDWQLRFIKNFCSYKHKTQEMTEHYTHWKIEDLREVMTIQERILEK